MSRTFDHKDYSYKCKATVHKKMPYVVVYVKIKTSEKDLLSSLAYMYKREKLLRVGCNANNLLINVVTGPNGIVLMCPENKIVNNISLFIQYISKTELKSNQFYGTKGSYNKLEEDLKHVDIHIVGKCKTFIKNKLEKDSDAIKKMMVSIVDRNVKKREDIMRSDFVDNQWRQIECSEEEALDIIVSFQDKYLEVVKISNGYKFKYRGASNWKTYGGTIRSLLKTYRGQSGSPGSPSSNDKDGKKWKEKCGSILDAVNEVSYCISDVRGTPCKYKDMDMIKTVNSKSVVFIKTM